LANALLNRCTVWPDGTPPDVVDGDSFRCIALQEQAGRLDPDSLAVRRGLALSQDDLGWRLWSRGQRVEAERLCRTALALRAEVFAREPSSRGILRYLARSQFHLAHMVAATNPAESEELYNAAQTTLAKLTDDFPTGIYFRKDLLVVLADRARVHRSRNQPDQAVAYYRQAVLHAERLFD